MASTILVDQVSWDLVLDLDGNIAVAAEPYALAQDAASAIRTFLGECYWDTLVGVPYKNILGENPQISLLKAELAAAAETVPGVAKATAFITKIADRSVQGQVQVIAKATGQVAAMNFTTINPQGVG